MFAIKFQCKEAVGSSGTVITIKDSLHWVCEESGGWVEATAQSDWWISQGFTKELKTFKTKEQAESFIKSWKGHPWYCVPNGIYEIIEVKPKYKQVIEGWEKA